MIEETTAPPGSAKKAARWLTWGFAAFGVAAAAAVIFLAVIALGFMWQAPRAPVQVAAGGKDAEQYSVQDVDDVPGTNWLKIEIGVGDRGGGSYSGRVADVRNLVLLDKLGGASHRLLPGNDRQIARSDFLPAAAMLEPVGAQGEPLVTVADAPEAKKGPPPPMAYYVVEVHQKDGPLLDVLVGNLASGAPAWLLTGIDGIDRMWMIDAVHLGVLMRQGMKLQYRVIDIPALRVVTAKPVDIG